MSLIIPLTGRVDHFPIGQQRGALIRSVVLRNLKQKRNDHAGPDTHLPKKRALCLRTKDPEELSEAVLSLLSKD